jgi:hypothetical protein
MGATKNRVIAENEKEIENERMRMMDADYRETQWKAGVVEVTFTRQYIFGRTEVYNIQKRGEDFYDAIERYALNNFKNDWDHLSPCTDDFKFDIIGE